MSSSPALQLVLLPARTDAPSLALPPSLQAPITKATDQLQGLLDDGAAWCNARVLCAGTEGCRLAAACC